MTSKPRIKQDYTMNPSINEQQDRVRGSVFDRLGAKQHIPQQSSQQSSYQIRSTNKYEQDARRKLDHSVYSSHSNSGQRFNYNHHNSYIQQQDSNQHHDDYYNKSNRISNPHQTSTKSHVLKSKINKDDYDNQYKRHFNEQNADILEKQRNDIKRELQKIDQTDQNIVKHHHRRHVEKTSSRRNYKTSPCSSHSCSSSESDSESGSESYSGSSGSCSGSSCTSSSFSGTEPNLNRQQSSSNYKKNISINSPINQQSRKYVNTSGNSSSLRNSGGHTPPIHHTHQQSKTSNKRYQPQQSEISSMKRLRSRSPQSTSSYYSKKSNRIGPPLTPPLPTSQHSLSNSNTPSSINKLDTTPTNVKFDRHGNIRVSLKDKERQRKINYDTKQQINSPSSINNYSKSSRSPLSRSREDLYSFGSDEKRKKFTPSPIHHHLQHPSSQQQIQHNTSHHLNRNKLNYHQNYSTNYDNSDYNNKMYDNRSNSGSSFGGYKQSSLRQNPLHRSSPNFNYDKNDSNYPSPIDYHYSPRTPMNTQQQHYNKSKEYDNRRLNYNKFNSDQYGNNYQNDLSHHPHPLDPLSINRQQAIKRNNNFNKFNNNNNNNNLISNYNSPLRTKSSLSNTHHLDQQYQQQPTYKKQNYNINNSNNNNNNNSNNQFTQIKPQFNQKQQNLMQLKQKLREKEDQLKKNLLNQDQKTVRSTNTQKIIEENKLDDEIDEISSISNNSIIEDIIEDDMQHAKSLKESEDNAKKLEIIKEEADDEKKVDDDENNNNKIKDLEKDDDDDSSSKKEEGELLSGNEITKEEEEEGEEKDNNNGNKQNELINSENDNSKNKDLNKPDEVISDENFSEWSDVEDYGKSVGDDKTENKMIIDNYDDLKLKIDELEAISDEEFDAIIDEQHLENEKNGMLSCKQVLDQLDINWESLIRDQDGENKSEDRKQQLNKKSSAKSRYKAALLLSQIGISGKYSGKELENLIKNYCCHELEDNFNFESKLAILHNLKIRKKINKISSDQTSSNTNLTTHETTEQNQTNMHTNSELLNDVELRKFLSNGNLINNKKILSFNHLVKNLKTQLNDNNKLDDKELKIDEKNTNLTDNTTNKVDDLINS